jgi:hypothetical protein
VDQTPATLPGSDAPDTTNTQVKKPHHHRLMHRAAAAAGEAQDTRWAHQPGTGESGPASSQASNIDSSDSHSTIAPHFPEPSQGPNASPDAYLHDAQAALAHHRTGLAQQALEMAETRLLDRSTAPDAAGTPDQNPEIRQVSQAREALGHGDVKGARSAIQMAIASGATHASTQASPGALATPAGSTIQ